MTLWEWQSQVAGVVGTRPGDGGGGEDCDPALYEWLARAG